MSAKAGLEHLEYPSDFNTYLISITFTYHNI